MFRNEVLVETAEGQMAGCTTADGQVRVFKGVPYALPPVGHRRWRPAEPAAAWAGVRSASAAAPACPQFPMPEAPVMYHHLPPTSEDCLYLNIWSPAEHPDELPVMVWIHGGGLFAGWANHAEYDGSELARRGVVVVAINYRLGIFGYLAHPELSAESPSMASGNYGTTDQIEALRWIQRNIRAFGGNPDSVTIFGESSGGWSISHLVASPLAGGLFHRAIAQSGVCNFPMLELRSNRWDQPSAEEVGVESVRALRVESIEELRKVPADALNRRWLELRLPTMAIVDGWVIPDQIYDIFESGRHNDVPLILGFNANEAALLAEVGAVPLPANEVEYQQAARSAYGPFADEFLELYPATDIRASVYTAYRNTHQGGWCAEAWARAQASHSSNAYLYLFSHHPPSPFSGMGACHMAEIPYVFRNLERSGDFSHPFLRLAPLSKQDMSLADAMSDYWVTFAKSGVPGRPGLPEWAPYSGEGSAYMDFTTEGPVQKRNQILNGAWDFHDRVNAWRRENNVYWSPVWDPGKVDGYSF